MRAQIVLALVFAAFAGVCSFSRVRPTFLKLPRSLKMGHLNEYFWMTPDGCNIQVFSTNSAAIINEKQITNEKLEDTMKNPGEDSFWSRTQDIWSSVFRQPKGSVEYFRPSLLFIHGSFHGGWCFTENYFDYFSALGHDCYSVSLRGTSGTGLPPDDMASSIPITQHIDDLKFVLKYITDIDRTTKYETSQSKKQPSKPIVIAHSFGGLILLKLLEGKNFRDSIGGAAFLCSVPPTGNLPMTKRFLKNRFIAALKIVCGFVFKKACTDKNLCREIFFDSSVPDESLRRYMKKFQADSRIGIDIATLAPLLPSNFAGPDKMAAWLEDELLEKTNKLGLEGVVLMNESVGRNFSAAKANSSNVAIGSLSNLNSNSNTSNSNYEGGNSESEALLKFPYIPALKISKSDDSERVEKVRRYVSSFINPPTLVVGAEKDFIVDKEGVLETATFLGVKPVYIPDMYHDVMLGPKWGAVATVIEIWIDNVGRRQGWIDSKQKAKK